MESSPWGSGGDDDYALPLPAPRPPSPLPSFGASTSPIAGGGWGDDGGWGTAVDDYSSAPAGAFSSKDLEESTEDFDDTVVAPASPVDGFGGGWGVPQSPQTYPTDRRSRSPPPETSSRPPSPPGFAPSPPLSPLARPLSPPAVLPADESTEEPVDGKGGWGGEGSPDLPPIASLKVQPESPTDTRSSGWGGDAEWTPPDIPPPLPSFGDAFGAPERADEEEKEEGWGGGEAVPSWTLGGHEAEQTSEPRSWEEASGEDSRRGKSIPASLVDGLKRDSREFGHSTWPVSPESWGQGGFQEQTSNVLMEPPSLPPASPTSSNPPITNDTPLSSLFKLTPTAFPNFHSGLAQTAARSAETLKGTSSAAYRNARFGGATRSVSGRTSVEGSTSRAGDEYDVDAPGAAIKPKSSWWGANGGQTRQEDSSVGVPDPAQVERERVTESPDPAPSALGRFFGRLKRPTNNPVTQAPSRPSTENQPEEPEWSPRDLDALDAPTSRIARAKQEESQMGADLDDFFGDTRATGRVPNKPPVEEFGGLMGAFSSAPARKVSQPSVKKSNKSLDPFDPFADEGDDEVSAVAPAIAPIIAKSPTRSILARVASPTPRPLTPHSPLRGATPEPSLPSPLAAPQARAVSSITSNLYDSTGDDSFDAFFSSVAPAKTSSAPPLVSPPLAPIRAQASSPRFSAAPPPRISTLVPPPRASTISPPSSASRLGALAPPPPPSQPLNRGGFSIAPPPSASSSLLNSRPLAATPQQAAPVAAAPKGPPPKPSGSGALSKDDWAFFEG